MNHELIFDQLDDGFIENKEPIIEENNFSYQHIKFNTKAKNKLRNTYLKTDKLSFLMEATKGWSISSAAIFAVNFFPSIKYATPSKEKAFLLGFLIPVNLSAWASDITL